MSSPVSFGDAFLMSKLAWTLAQAFTQGRKSAPAEFREVENQLYAISSALQAFKKACDDGNAALPADASHLGTRPAGDETIQNILANCDKTLKHLEEVVKKYGGIVQENDPEKPFVKRWARNLVKDYKKIAWTTEKGDLAALRSQLMIHTNSLDLVIGVILNSQSARIEDILKSNSTILNEIHSWLIHGLHNANLPSSQLTHGTGGANGFTQMAPYAPPITFEVYVESEGNRLLVCDQASLNEKWGTTQESSNSNDLVWFFNCQCQSAATPGIARHQKKLSGYTTSHLTFPFRMLGTRRSWMLYKAADLASNRLVSLFIENVPIENVFEFEKTFIDVLSETVAERMLRHGMANMLVHVSPDTQNEHILDLRSDLKEAHKSLQTVMIAFDQRIYTRNSITGLGLFHYKIRGSTSLDLYGFTESSATICDFAEIVVDYGDEEDSAQGDITRSILHLQRNTPVKMLDEQTTVVVCGVRCLGYVRGNPTNSIEKTDVTFRFTTPQASHRVYDQLEAMKMELFVWSLQYPQGNEDIALHLQTAQVQCEEVFISDAELFVVRDTNAGFRLIIVSRNKCTIMSQVLASDFFTSTSGANFQSPTWLVQLEGGCERKVYRYPNGFKLMSFHSAESERMFELGRNALSRAALRSIGST